MAKAYRWIILAAVFGMVRADDAAAQLSLSSIVIPTDTSGSRKAAGPVKPAASHKFLRNQLENERVLDARIEKRFELKKLFRERGIAYPAEEIFMRIFKRERQLEMWVRPAGHTEFALLRSYEICALGDKPGPKRVQGDRQTPEGFYYIDDFNPRSGYYLSLHVNYPNESDRILGSAADMGGDIFVHGDCKTAGCIAVTDENIKEIYLLAVEARDHGQQRIPVHIFPARLTNDAFAQYDRVFNDRQDLVSFWSNLKLGYDFFETKRRLPVVDVNKRGRYVFRTSEPKSSL